ncbi:MAG TPA: MFS transporter [Devosia sp.]|nr:MFS transporter [Devosia sp.]
MTAGAVPETRMPTGALFGVIASVTVFGVAQGLSNPLFTFLMQKQGISASAIGLSAAMTPLGLMCSSLFVPVLVRLLGARTLAVGSAVSAALLFLFIGLTQNWLAWYPARFLIGLAVNPLYILGEVWLIALAPAARRGRILGVFNAITGAGYASGPLSLALLGTDGWAPFLVGIVGFVGCALILSFVANSLTSFDDGERHGSALHFWVLAPSLLLAVTVASATQQSMYSLLPVFGTGYQLAEGTLATLISVMSIGNIILQIPLGLMAERLGGRKMIIACALVNMTSALLLPFLVTTALQWPLLLIMGGVGYGVYTMALVDMGNRFSGSALVAGNAAFGLMWGVGGMIGPPAAGFFMQTFGPVGLPAMIAVLSAILVGFSTFRSFTRRRA